MLVQVDVLVMAFHPDILVLGIIPKMSPFRPLEMFGGVSGFFCWLGHHFSILSQYPNDSLRPTHKLSYSLDPTC